MISLSDIDLERKHYQTLTVKEEDWRCRAGFLDRLREVLHRLPEVEQDVVELYFYDGKRQESIARILGVTQQAVSHRLLSAVRRLTFLLEQPRVDPEQMRRDLRGVDLTDATVDVLCDFASTASPSVTARNLGIHQQRVITLISATLVKLREQSSVDALFYADFFGKLFAGRNILRIRREKPAAH